MGLNLAENKRIYFEANDDVSLLHPGGLSKRCSNGLLLFIRSDHGLSPKIRVPVLNFEMLLYFQVNYDFRSYKSTTLTTYTGHLLV